MHYCILVGQSEVAIDCNLSMKQCMKHILAMIIIKNSHVTVHCSSELPAGIEPRMDGRSTRLGLPIANVSATTYHLLLVDDGINAICLHHLHVSHMCLQQISQETSSI